MMMFLRSALVAGSVATFGQAFLLPPSVSSADTEIVTALPFEAKSATESRILYLECRTCPVPTYHHSELTWIYDVESKLELNFAVFEWEVDTLQLNGVQIYPPHTLPLEALGAPQITQQTRDNNYTVFLRLGYELNITPVVRPIEDQFELILIQLQVVEIAGMFVDGLESVVVKLLKTPSGKLMIGQLETAPTVNHGGRHCQTLLCKLKSIVNGKVSELKSEKGCGSKKSSQAFPQGHGDHGSRHGPHHHHRPHGLSRFLYKLKKAAFHIIIPVLIGIVAGFTASLIGMFVGQLIVFLWRSFYRCGRKGPYSTTEKEERVVDEEEEEEEEKQLVEHQDPPPVYEGRLE